MEFWTVLMTLASIFFILLGGLMCYLDGLIVSDSCTRNTDIMEDESCINVKCSSSSQINIQIIGFCLGIVF